MTLTDALHADVCEVVALTYYGGGLAVQATAARALAPAVACAASLGLISTRVPDGFSKRWLATGRGILFLEGKPL